MSISCAVGFFQELRTQELMEEPKAMHPGRRGFSERSVRRFCLKRGIHFRRGLSSSEVDIVVAETVNEVGPTYGRRTMRGLLISRGIGVSERRVGIYRHQNTSRKTNPMPYWAE